MYQCSGETSDQDIAWPREGAVSVQDPSVVEKEKIPLGDLHLDNVVRSITLTMEGLYGFVEHFRLYCREIPLYGSLSIIEQYLKQSCIESTKNSWKFRRPRSLI